MGSNPTKAANNMYCKCRLAAAKYNDKLNSREGAAEMLGLSSSTLASYELDLTNVCPLGAEFPKIEIEDLDRLTIKALSTLRKISNVKEDLLDITADGAISVEERPKLNNVIKTLDEISNVAQSLKLWAKKNLSKTE